MTSKVFFKNEILALRAEIYQRVNGKPKYQCLQCTAFALLLFSTGSEGLSCILTSQLNSWNGSEWYKNLILNKADSRGEGRIIWNCWSLDKVNCKMFEEKLTQSSLHLGLYLIIRDGFATLILRYYLRLLVYSLRNERAIVFWQWIWQRISTDLSRARKLKRALKARFSKRYFRKTNLRVAQVMFQV